MLTTFSYTDPHSFVALASVLEGVGVSAYLGAAADIANPDYLTEAGAILTIEARHSSYLRAALSEVPFPASLDTPLDFEQVYSLAIPFFVSCPAANPLIALGIKGFPSLAINTTTTGPITVGSTITLETPGYTRKSSPRPVTNIVSPKHYSSLVGGAHCVLSSFLCSHALTIHRVCSKR